MQQLPLTKLYCQNQIACRFLRAPAIDDTLVITIPGGPMLSGRYLDHFLMQLAEHSNVNVGIIDLPNHGDSTVPADKLPLSYGSCMEIVNQMLNEVSQECGKLILFGQSFGARLAFDLLAQSTPTISGAFLTGFPYMFQMSSAMMKKISTLDMGSSEGSLEEKFVNSWSKILPLYSYSPLSPEVFNALTSNLKLSGNERILGNVPAIEKVAEILSQKSTSPSITIVHGMIDEVTPDNNLEKLKSIVPYADFYEIEKCGHFPMAENPTETLHAFSQLMSKIANS